MSLYLDEFQEPLNCTGVAGGFHRVKDMLEACQDVVRMSKGAGGHMVLDKVATVPVDAETSSSQSNSQDTAALKATPRYQRSWRGPESDPAPHCPGVPTTSALHAIFIARGRCPP